MRPNSNHLLHQLSGNLLHQLSVNLLHQLSVNLRWWFIWFYSTSFNAILFAIFLYRDDGIGILFFINCLLFLVKILIVFFQVVGQNAETTVFIKQEIEKQNEYQSENGRDVDVARSHPGHGKNEDLSTKGVFKVFLGGGTEFEIHEFGRNIENDDH